MVKGHFRKAGLAGLVLLLFILAGTSVWGAKNLVIDLAGSFSDTEITALEQSAQQLGAQYKMDIVIVTTDDAGGKSAQAFADDYFDEHGYGVGSDFSGILFLIDFDNRDASLSTSGIGIRYLTDQRINKILDDVVSYLSNDDAYGAAQAFLTSTAQYLSAGIPSNQYSEPEGEPNRLTVMDGLIGVLVSGVTGLVFFGGVKGAYKGKNQAGVFDYHRNSLLNLGITQDNLTNTFVTSRIRPAPTSGGSSGRSTTHTSSSGRTHGGGSRHF
ncbi:MAG: TPM domain-containing protein [Clostridiaceae bacterium]|nr:TPM domain-containing protein [Clostridiaceae bacterium]